MNNARRQAIFALTLWQTRGLFPFDALGDTPDRPFAQELIGAVLRNKASLEWALKRCVKRLPEGDLLATLQVGAAQLLVLPGVADHAAVAETVEAAKAIGKGAAGFVNAVLRRLQRERSTLAEALLKEPEPLRRNLPTELWRRWIAAFGKARARAIAEAIAMPPPVCIRPLPPHPVPNGCAPHPDDPQGTVVLPRGKRVALLPGYAEGHFVVQDPITRHAIEALDIRPGQRILDACAAPGGKTAQIAARLFHEAPAGVLTANEVSPRRLETLRDTLTRCVPNKPIRLTCTDAAVPPPPDESPYDRILLDAPCSNTGVLGRRPDARWTWSPQKMRQLCATQTALLEACAARLKPGGRLVYSTCSLEPEEDEAQVDAFLNRHPDFQAGQKTRYFPTPEHDGAFVATLFRSC